MTALRSGFTLTLYMALSALLISCVTDAPVSLDESGNAAPGSQWQRIPSNSTDVVAIKYFGFLDVTQDEEHEAQFFEAGFARFEDTAPLSVLLNSFKQPLLDTCDFRQQALGDSTPLVFRDELALPGYPYDFVSVGSRINVSRGSRRYAKLVRTSTNPEHAVQYETDVGSLPLSFGGIRFGDVLMKSQGLRIASAGDVFPGFSGIVLPSVDLVASFKPTASGRVTADTKFRWRKGRYAGDPELRVQIEAGGGGRAIFCAVADDGSFQLPDLVKTELQGSSIPNIDVYRDAIWFYLHDDALLIVSQSTYY